MDLTAENWFLLGKIPFNWFFIDFDSFFCSLVVKCFEFIDLLGNSSFNKLVIADLLIM